MALTLRRIMLSDDTATLDYIVMSGNLPIGRVHEAAESPENRWIWTIFGVTAGPAVMETGGRMGTLDDARGRLEANWKKWLAWAKLAELN